VKGIKLTENLADVASLLLSPGWALRGDVGADQAGGAATVVGQ
jgi:hypothetical protein